jgi:hypothetical protein
MSEYINGTCLNIKNGLFTTSSDGKENIIF